MELRIVFLLLCGIALVMLLQMRTVGAPTTAPAADPNTRSNTLGGESERDHIALLDFKSNIKQDPHGVLSSWNDSLHFCQWQGITCGLRHVRVTVIDFENGGLMGSLSPFVGNLSFLRELRLFNNSLQGKIPPEIGRLFRLVILRLSYNYFEGEIPANLSHCSKLQFLRLGSNKLVGKIPVELASLSKLIAISIDYNNLTGKIPPHIGNLTLLQSFSASFVGLRGSIPDSLGRLQSLTFLGLGANELSNTVPPSIYNLSSIATLSLASNQLQGNLPPNLGLSLPNLQYLQLWGNYFNGSIPGSLSNASGIIRIELQRNNFTGKVLLDFRDLQLLSFINLGENSLGSGEADDLSFLIASLANCTNLEYLGMEENHFQGALPNSIANFSAPLKRIVIGENQISGSLPSWIGTLVNLIVLAMEDNQFTGAIPIDIGKLYKLQGVDLHANRLSGEIPSSLGNLSILNELYLGSNRLQGNIPSSLGNCQKLVTLSLSQNNLSGTIPIPLFNALSLSISLNLAQNHLVGSLPSEISNLDKLSEFDVSENQLSSEIPTSLSRCTSLEYLYLRGNLFRGPIPPSLSSLKGLQNFDLSHNNLSGQIPSFLEHFSLENLNLSFNNFEGEVPIKGIFTNASAISVVGNEKLCGGIPELQLPRCIIRESKTKKMSLKLKLIISAICALVGVCAISALLFHWVKMKRISQPSGSLMKESFLKVSYERLLKATDGFSSENLIGVGSFGSVYKGILDVEGTIVAVKVVNLQRQGASKSFMTECEALKNIRHRNLMKILTSCSSIDFQGNDFKALVYEFMPNGNLERWLHPTPEIDANQDEHHILNLVQRLNIAIDIANALNYLHHDCQTPIIHCDLKPSNVLLDRDMIAHVGDFGLVKFLSKLINPHQSSSVGVRGTVGYTAPEYGLGSEVSASGDVYSYGILLLEMMTGKRPTDHIFVEGLNIHNFAKTAFPDRVLMEIVDPIILNDLEAATTNKNQSPEQARNGKKMVECIISMIKIGIACSMESPQDRIGISNVIHELHLVRDNYSRN